MTFIIDSKQRWGAAKCNPIKSRRHTTINLPRDTDVLTESHTPCIELWKFRQEISTTVIKIMVHILMSMLTMKQKKTISFIYNEQSDLTGDSSGN